MFHTHFVNAMSKGFGSQPQSELDKVVDRVVRYCQKRSPEGLDKVFDSLPKNDQSQHIINHITDQLHSDPDTLAWFCGYMASEINCREDSDRARLPITELSKTLILLRMQPFVEFMPYPGQRIVILAPEKFEELPQSIQSKLKQAFDFSDRSGEELLQINEAIRQELEVNP